MSRFQSASFEINGRVAHMQPLQTVVKLTVAVSNRTSSGEAPSTWKAAGTAVFGLSVEDPGLREYVTQFVAIGDLVLIKGNLSSTHFNGAQSPKPSSGIRLVVTHIVAVPKRQADRLDAIPPVAADAASSGEPSF
ncbi:hypothetical protein [Bosea massiliensis]|uniref:Single-stranded DNA-binding protein n=1 Tax=Bosea massiliensis TaxID=151419 RepID=A0ABW0P7Z3_9HYPH